VHVAGLNLALLMRTRFGVGKPRCLQDRSAALGAAAAVLLRLLCHLWHQMRSVLRVESLWPTVAVSHVSA
jgi:hypothetical protein